MAKQKAKPSDTASDGKPYGSTPRTIGSRPTVPSKKMRKTTTLEKVGYAIKNSFNQNPNQAVADSVEVTTKRKK